MLTLCQNEFIEIFGIKLEKSIAAMIITFLDIINMLIFLIFLNLLKNMQKSYVKFFDKETVEMKDFAVRIDKLPETFKQYKNEYKMKEGIWRQIVKKIRDAKKAKLCPEDLDESIVDISFGLRNFDVLNDLVEIEKMNKEMEKLNIKYYRNPSKSLENQIRQN